MSGVSFLGKVGQLPSVIPNHATTIATADVDSEDDEMQQRLQALRSWFFYFNDC